MPGAHARWLPTMMWSRISMLKISPAVWSRRVTPWSSLLGVGSPAGKMSTTKSPGILRRRNFERFRRFAGLGHSASQLNTGHDLVVSRLFDRYFDRFQFASSGSRTAAANQSCQQLRVRPLLGSVFLQTLTRTLAFGRFPDLGAIQFVVQTATGGELITAGVSPKVHGDFVFVANVPARSQLES